jgi:ABC-type branched-subunit amino acid transport system substrate-binding protein
MSRDHVEAVYFCDNGTWMSDTDSEFVQTFSREFGRYPGLMAAYAYDAIKILAQAIGNSGPDPQKLRESLSKTHYSGKTGAIEFDRFGNRKSTLKPGVVSSEILSASKP